MANVVVTKVGTQQVINVIGDPLAPNTVPASLAHGDTIYREDTSTHYTFGPTGVIAGVGSPSVHEHVASDVTGGVFDPERLGTGTPNSTTVLLGDGTWGAGVPAIDHATDHEEGGGDEIDLGALAGTITAAQHGTPAGDLHPGYALDSDLATHEAAADPHTVYQKESEKGAALGYASLDAATLVPIAQIPTGATSSAVCIGNDSRLSDARTPTAHTHDDRYYTESETDTLLAAKGTSNFDGAYASLSGKPTLGTAAAAATGDFATAAQGTKADSAIQAAGMTKAAVGLGSVDNTADASKPVSTAQQTALDLKANVTAKLDDFGTPDDNTDLNATAGRHGLLPKLSGSASEYLSGAGTWASVPGGSDLALSKNAPSADVTVTAGYTGHVSRKYTIGSGLKLTIGSSAYMRIH